MTKPKYKEFTKKEEKIYDKAIEEIRENLKKGMDFEVACNAVKVKDDDLKLLILEDFLKITIAEKYFSERKTFDEIAKELNVDKDIIIRTYNIMLDDIMNTQKNKLDLGKPEDLGINPPKGNA